MFKRSLTVLLALAVSFVFPAIVHAQNPIGSLTASYVYTYSLSNQPFPYDHNRSLMGWSAVPALNLTNHIAWIGEGTNLYVRSVYPGQTRLILASGFKFSFAPHYKATPFVFAEGGEMRLSQQYDPVKDWNPVAMGGFGFDVPISHGFGFTLIPGEYVGQYQDDGSWAHSFSARAGITFNLYR